MSKQRPSLCGALVAWAVALAAVLSAGHAPAAGQEANGLAALVDQIPDADPGGKHTGPDPAAAEKIYLEVLKGGKPSVAGLVGLVKEKGGDDFKARYVINGLATYVAAPGREPERALVCEALAGTLGGAAPKPVQAFVLQEIRYIGGKEALPAAGKLLADDELCEPAAQALLAIRAGAAPLFRQALPGAAGKRRITIVQALGVLREPAAAGEIRKLAGDADRDTRLAAIDALAAIGDAGSVDTLLAACDVQAPYERNHNTAAALALAQRLAGANKPQPAERIYRRLFNTRSTPAERHVRIAALNGLIELTNETADLLAAVRAGDPQVRAYAVQLVKQGAGKEPTASLLVPGPASGRLVLRGDAPTRGAALSLLAARQTPGALETVAASLGDKETPVRVGALWALPLVGGEEQVPLAAERLKQATDETEISAAAEALIALCGRRLGGPCADAVAPALAQAPPANAYPMMYVLRAAGGTKAADAVAACLTKPDVQLRDTAIRVLSAWRSPEAAGPLLEVARAAGAEEHGRAALQGAVAVAKRVSPDDRVKIVSEALKAAPGPQEKRDVLAALSGTRTPAALKLAAAALEDEALKEAAARLVVEIAGGVVKADPEGVRDAVTKALPAIKDERVRNDAQKILDQVKQ